jgi:enamine deaminase RidA (YjgF/YER057c/UK114 family)
MIGHALANARRTIKLAASMRRNQMAKIAALNPDTLGVPQGTYSRAMRVQASEFLFIAGMASSDSGGNVVAAHDFDGQCKQVFSNIEAALHAAGAGWGNVVQFTSYLVDRADQPKFASWRQHHFPAMFPNKIYPPNALLIVNGLAHRDYLVEVQAIAAL